MFKGNSTSYRVRGPTGAIRGEHLAADAQSAAGLDVSTGRAAATVTQVPGIATVAAGAAGPGGSGCATGGFFESVMKRKIFGKYWNINEINGGLSFYASE